MPNKPWDQLNELDRLLRKHGPGAGPGTTGTQITIRLICGFELFNTRPYHNYETFSDGYVVEGRGIEHRGEDLDEAIIGWCRKVAAAEAALGEANPPTWARGFGGDPLLPPKEVPHDT